MLPIPLFTGAFCDPAAKTADLGRPVCRPSRVVCTFPESFKDCCALNSSAIVNNGSAKQGEKSSRPTAMTLERLAATIAQDRELSKKRPEGIPSRGPGVALFVVGSAASSAPSRAVCL